MYEKAILTDSADSACDEEVIPCHIKVADPVFVNHCSYDTRTIVLRDIGVKSGIH